MRILVVSNLYPSPARPGMGTFVQARVAELRRAGAHVEVLAIRGGVAHRGVKRKYAALGLRAIQATVGALVRWRRYDVVEAHIGYPTGWLAWPIARVGGSLLVLFAHGADVVDLPDRSRLHAFLSARIFRCADLAICNSEFLAGRLRARVPRGDLDVHVISPGIDLSRFGSVAAGADRSGILYVGRLTVGKGVQLLIEAYSMMDAPRPALTIVGSGPQLDTLRSLAQSAGDRVLFLGELGPARVAAEMARAAVLAVPAVADEALGLVAIEGMASGALVVATNSGGLAETVLDGVTGIVVPAGDRRGLAEALTRAIQEPEASARRLRVAARKMAERHDIGSAVRRSLLLYEQAGAAPQ